ncbi:MAG: UDP-N-acetylglucosamine--N-acetylmuramyl-(pentapeptide) pyrophosphoryl-undecaprenol N-acetylglucosamine transferase [Planctomycetes bacterium]|nr:UDP-N-acetylglucosamine--N-acetylmuramyl-(pentapeptide) pyrophosphoryl-undecaprenol N-acetylglucosamine transferase [Planctomycetota bacterium]
MVRRVCLVSGGTGGHLMPALVLARALQQRGHAAMLVTEGREVERELLRRELPDVAEARLPAASGRGLAVPLWLARATVAARAMLREHAVDLVVSTGGRASLPVGLAARSLGKPLFLLEQNAVTGRVNRLLAPLARRIYHGLPVAGGLGARGLLTGTPLRPQFQRIDRAHCREVLGLPVEATVVLVTGGSQGARPLNEIVPVALGRLPFAVHVLHLAGPGRDEAVRRLYAAGEGRATAHVRPVAADMDRMFGAADLVVCRGGGTTIAELTAAGRAALVVPYPHHRDRQQVHNAEVLQRVGAATVVEERDLTVETAVAWLAALLADRERLRAMGEAAGRLRTADPAAAILGDMGLNEVGGEAVAAAGVRS